MPLLHPMTVPIRGAMDLQTEMTALTLVESKLPTRAQHQIYKKLKALQTVKKPRS